MIPAPAPPKFAGAPRAAAGPGPGRGRGRGRPPRSPPRRRPRDRGERGGRGRGRLFSAPFSSGFWAARRGPLPAGVGSGRATPGAGRGARVALGEQGARARGWVGSGLQRCRRARPGRAWAGRGRRACQVLAPPERSGPLGSPAVRGTRSSVGARSGAPELGCPQRGTPDVPSGVRGVTEVGEDRGLLSASGRWVRAAFYPDPRISEPPSRGFEGPFCGSRSGGSSSPFPGAGARRSQETPPEVVRRLQAVPRSLPQGSREAWGGGEKDGEVRV